jgi:predicted component of type VI protein secretion system
MKVRLKILHGTLQDAHGHRAAQEVKVRGPRFVIGRADDCSMCCRSDSVLPHHCELLVDRQRAIIRPLSDQAGTFVNGRLVELEQTLQSGDLLRIGRMDFEVLITTEPVPAQATEELQAGPASDSAAEEISDLLVQADERERIERQEHPELRVLHLKAAGEEPAQSAADEAAAAAETAKHKPGKKKPGKLPTRPQKDEIKGDDSTEAAQAALRKLFSR